MSVSVREVGGLGEYGKWRITPTPPPPTNNDILYCCLLGVVVLYVATCMHNHMHEITCIRG